MAKAPQLASRWDLFRETGNSGMGLCALGCLVEAVTRCLTHSLNFPHLPRPQLQAQAAGPRQGAGAQRGVGAVHHGRRAAAARPGPGGRRHAAALQDGHAGGWCKLRRAKGVEQSKRFSRAAESTACLRIGCIQRTVPIPCHFVAWDYLSNGTRCCPRTLGPQALDAVALHLPAASVYPSVRWQGPCWGRSRRYHSV